jgi:hypothetical protein
MKNITELTEQEILALTDEDVLTMIKLRKAEEGIKLLEKPTEPELFTIEPPDMVVYSCELFGSFAFSSPSDMEELVTFIKSKQGKFIVDYNYGQLDSSFKFASEKLSKYSSDWSEIKSQRVYSFELYNKIADKAKHNKKMQEDYDKSYKEYTAAINEAKWIEDEINDRVREVADKYYSLNRHCYRFKHDYMPLSKNDETIAMSFMVKAYNLTDEQQEYVLANYKDVK